MTNVKDSEKSTEVEISSKFKKLDEISSDYELDPTQVQPFAVKICPDAAFVSDLHAHLSESEIIGLLGGRYVPSERCIYVQAAFPCKATSRGDAGLTDVEMDPVSQIAAGDAIVNHGMTVVGWYHSHPRFQPDPSITDIENQSNYQNLFQSEIFKSDKNQVCPFVGLIIGTYDGKGINKKIISLHDEYFLFKTYLFLFLCSLFLGRNPSAQSVMRWFHVTKKQSNNREPSGKENDGKKVQSKNEVNFPMKLQVIHRKSRDFQFGKLSNLYPIFLSYVTF